MTLKELRRIFDKNTPIYLTALAYYKETKKYYSFMTIYGEEDDVDFSDEAAFSDDKYFMDCDVRHVYIDYRKHCVRIDIITWIEGSEEES